MTNRNVTSGVNHLIHRSLCTVKLNTRKGRYLLPLNRPGHYSKLSLLRLNFVVIQRKSNNSFHYLTFTSPSFGSLKCTTKICLKDTLFYAQRYFCGVSAECRSFASLWALDEAKRNVGKYFAVVGIRERLEETLKLFERKFSGPFKGLAGKIDAHITVH